MKKALFALLTIVVLVQCRKEVDPPKEIAALAGTWYLAETLEEVDGKLQWRTNISQYPWNQTFRSDGLLVDDQGRSVCCAPTTLIYNGKLVVVNPEGKVQLPNCAAVHCSGCTQWKITQRGDEMILETCGSFTGKFRKMP